MLLLLISATGIIGSLVFDFLFFPSLPGYIFSLSLPSNIPVQTQTQTHVSTSIQTQTQVSTSTVVSSVTIPTGIDPSTFYAAVGVAVIFVITTGVLAVRRRGPAAP